MNITFVSFLTHWLLCLTLPLTILYFVFIYKNSYWKKRGVPQETPLPIVGNFLKVFQGKASARTLISELYQKFDEPYFGISVFNLNALIVKKPELIKNVLVKDFNVFENRHFASNEKADPIAYNTLFSLPNPKWKALRTKLSPVFTSGKIKLMVNLMKTCSDNLLDHLNANNGKICEMKDICGKFTTDVIASCAFGINTNCFIQENSEFHACGKKIFSTDFKNVFSQMSYFFIPFLVPLLKLKFIEATSAKFLEKVFWETMQERKNANIFRNDLIDILSAIKDETKPDDEIKFDNTVMAAQAIIFFSAGHESTSSVISFTLYELAIQPDIQQRLREDIKSAIAKHGDITYDAIADMKYLDLIVQEALRKYPLAPMLSRKNTVAYTFENTNLTIEKGTPVMIPLTALHYDEKLFPNPEKFDPERYSPENKSKIVPYTYLPFGDGPRNCIGARFALIAVKIGLIYIVKNFEIEKCAETPVPLKCVETSNLLRAVNGIPLRIRKLNV